MTSAIPGYISWPVFACFVLVLAFRRRWLGTGLAARHRNRALTYLAATQLTAEPAVQHLLATTIPSTAGTASQIPLALLLLTCPEVIGVIAMTDGIDPAALVRGYRRYRIATVVTIAVLYFVAVSPRRQDQPIALASDNSEVLAAAIWSVLSVTAATVIWWQLTKNLRHTRTTTAQRLIAIELSAIAALICLPGLSIFTLALLERLDLAHTLPVRQAIYSYASFGALLLALPLAFGPCVVAAQALLHRDTNGRTWRKLQPLWTDLTTAYPDTILNAPPQRFQPVTDFQLHRIIIEIRDALLQLAPHFTALDDTDRQRLAQASRLQAVDQSALQALQIRQRHHTPSHHRPHAHQQHTPGHHRHPRRRTHPTHRHRHLVANSHPHCGGRSCRGNCPTRLMNALVTRDYPRCVPESAAIAEVLWHRPAFETCCQNIC